MSADPNARLIKAVEDLARAVSQNTKAVDDLKKEIKGRLPKSLTFTNHPYLEDSTPPVTPDETSGR